MPSINHFTLEDIYNKTSTEENSVAFAIELGLIKINEKCLICDGVMKIRQRTGKNKGFYSRCTTKSCRKEISLKKNNFFENVHLEFQTILRML